jgi:CheY-like chemotaxis protein
VHERTIHMIRSLRIRRRTSCCSSRSTFARWRHIRAISNWPDSGSRQRRVPADGLSQAWELQPNLLVTDFSFGGHPAGADLIRAVKKDLRTSHIPVLVLSETALVGLPSDTQREADSVLVKPVMPSVLYSRGKALIRASMELRSRSLAALKRAEALSRQNIIVRERGREVGGHLRQRPRACPKCGSELEWLEEAMLGGVEYDYYRWCLKGCGLYCFDHRARDWVKLAGP